MERLIYHSNPTPTKLYLHPNLNLNFNLKPYPFLPRLDAQKPFSSSSSSSLSSSTAGSRRLISVFCKRKDLSSNYSRSSSAEFPDNYSVKSSSPSLSPAELPDGSMRKPRFLAQTISQQRKAVAGGTVILLSVIFMTLLHPMFASPAFAAFRNAAAKTGRFARSELLSSAWTGFFAGCLHTLSGPDHLAALAPLSIGRTRMESAAVGALWGCGHDAGQVIFGLLFLLLKDKLHIEVIRTWGTRVVGFTLLVIGGMGIREASEIPTPCVALENGECDVSGTYESAPSPFDNPAVGKKKKIGFATFATGIVHGLQPDALMMVLPALALPSRLAGAAFLGMFLVGTVIAMGSYTVFIGSCSEALKERVPRITEKLTWVSSLIAIALGFAILISQFFGFSLY